MVPDCKANHLPLTISLSAFKGRVREEEQRMSNVDSFNDSGSSAAAYYGRHNTGGNSNRGSINSGNGRATQKTGKRPGNCNSFGEKGHWARECRKKPTDEKDKKQKAPPNRKDDRDEDASDRAFSGMAFGFLNDLQPYAGLAHTFTAARDPSKRRQRHR